MKRTALIFCVMGITALSVSAQDENLNKEIVVEKDYTPIEQKASKLSLQPSVVQFEPTASNLTFSMQNTPVSTGNALSTLPAYGYLTRFVDKDPRGYVNFAMGSYLNINGAAGFKIIDTKKSKLAVFTSHQSTGGVKNDLIYNYYGENKYFPDRANLQFKQKWNTERAGINFTQTAGNCLIYSNATYNYSRVQINKYFWTDDADYYSYTGSHDIDFNLGFKRITAGTTNYYANVNVNYFDYKYQVYSPMKNRQTFVKFEGGLSQRISERYEAGVKIEGNFLHTTLISGDTTTYSFIPVQYMTPTTHASDMGLIRLTPYYAKKEGKLKYHLGLNVDMRIKDGSFLKISPDVTAMYEIVKGVSVYGTATGGTYYNLLYDLTTENPYSMPNNRNYKRSTYFIKFNNSSFTLVDARIGIAIDAFKGFRMKLYGGYANTKDLALPIDAEPQRTDKTIDGKRNEYYTLGQGDFFNRNLYGFMWGADIDYSYSGLLDFHFGIKNAKQTENGNGYYLGNDLPRWIISTKVGVNPINRLHIDLGYELRSGRKSINAFYIAYPTIFTRMEDIYFPDDDTDIGYKPTKLSNVSNLWMRAEYKVTDYLSVNVQATNMLNKTWQVADLYRNQGIAVMGGIALQFK